MHEKTKLRVNLIKGLISHWAKRVYAQGVLMWYAIAMMLTLRGGISKYLCGTCCIVIDDHDGVRTILSESQRS